MNNSYANPNIGGLSIRPHENTLSSTIFNADSHTIITGHNAMNAIAQASSSTVSDASTITSSDFLTLLVSELQNQDPTEPTDPNAYITQLVGVNSLQQLIAIDQGITNLDPTTATSTSSISSSQLGDYTKSSTI
jgi:flagellar hook assembly protein FlgD